MGSARLHDAVRGAGLVGGAVRGSDHQSVRGDRFGFGQSVDRDRAAMAMADAGTGVHFRAAAGVFAFVQRVDRTSVRAAARLGILGVSETTILADGACDRHDPAEPARRVRLRAARGDGTGRPSAADLAARVDPAVDRLGLDRLAFIGFAGALVALAGRKLAVRRAELVRPRADLAFRGPDAGGHVIADFSRRPCSAPGFA